ncbi:MAG: hypothetical protein JXQ90_10245 [Cyclobacteriaceae bacterium]
MKFKHTLLLFFSFIAFVQCSEQVIDSTYIVSQTVAYHDPTGQWSTISTALFFEESRPDGSIRETSVMIDNSSGFFQMDRGNGQSGSLSQNECKVLGDSITCDRLTTMRNYYTYLWGLPMKLMDTPDLLDQNFSEDEFEGRSCYIVKVVYEKDTWEYFIAKDNFKMIAYKFIKNDGSGNGEVIKLEGQMLIGNMRIPQRRSWYTIPENKYLGTDKLVNVKIL